MYILFAIYRPIEIDAKKYFLMKSESSPFLKTPRKA